MCLFAQTLPVVAVAPFDVVSGVSQADADAINRLFYIRFGNSPKVILVDRSVVDRVLKEHSFQLSDWSSDSKTAELSRALNANWLVRGTLEKFGSNILVSAQLYDINSFQFVSGADTRFTDIDAAYEAMDVLVNKLVNAMSGTTVSVSNTSGNYKIGGTGPAGGIIFYDQGAVINGWRYLEAAPAVAEFEEKWGAFRKNVTGTKKDIGTGKDNTKNIARFLNSIGEKDKAAQRCIALNINGYNDWFLPSRDELNLMYVNLHKKGLGGFQNEAYWSSSQYDAYNFDCVWYQYFHIGLQQHSLFDKNDPFRVRAVRAF